MVANILYNTHLFRAKCRIVLSAMASEPTETYRETINLNLTVYKLLVRVYLCIVFVSLKACVCLFATSPISYSSIPAANTRTKMAWVRNTIITFAEAAHTQLNG